MRKLSLNKWKQLHGPGQKPRLSNQQQIPGSLYQLSMGVGSPSSQEKVADPKGSSINYRQNKGTWYAWCTTKESWG